MRGIAAPPVQTLAPRAPVTAPSTSVAPAGRNNSRMAALRAMMQRSGGARPGPLQATPAAGPVGNLMSTPANSSFGGGLPPGSRSSAQAANEGIDPLRSLTTGWI